MVNSIIDRLIKCQVLQLRQGGSRSECADFTHFDGVETLFAKLQFFKFRFEIHRDHVARVSIKQETWELACTSLPASEYTGSIGLFVKSGTLLVYAMNVQ